MGHAELEAGFIDAAEVGDARHWQPPTLERGTGGPPTAAKLEALEQAAWDEGYKRGREEGRAAAREAAQPQLQQLTTLLSALEQPFDAEAETLTEALAALALEIAQRLTLNALTLQPEALMPIARQALAMLGEHSGPIQLRVPPAAFEALRALEQEPALQARVSADAALGPADVGVDANPVSIDARLTTRVQQLMAGWTEDTP